MIDILAIFYYPYSKVREIVSKVIKALLENRIGENMKVMKKLLAVTVAMCAISSVALAKPCALEAKTPSYAHPTLFKSQAQTLVDAKSVYVTGGRNF